MINRQDCKTGEIRDPSKDWPSVRLEDILSLEYGSGLTESGRVSGKYPVYGSHGMVGYHNRPLVKGPGIVVGRKGTVGAVSWAESDFWPIDTTYYVALKRDDISARWLYYRLIDLRLNRLNASTGVPGLNRNDVHSIRIALPSFLEQQKIASILSTVDDAIQKTDEIIAKTQQLKKGLMQQLLTKGIEHTKFKQTEIGEIPEEWEVVKLGDYIDSGPQNGIYKPESLYGQGTPIVRIDDFYDGTFTRPSGFERVTLSNEEIRTHQLNPFDILVNRVNSLPFLGKSAIVPQLEEPTVFESNVMRLMVRPEVLLPEYAIKWLCAENARAHFRRRAKRAIAQASINQGDVCSLLIPRPSIDEQREIVNVLSSVDEKSVKETLRKQQFERLKTGLMQALLSGKVRVKVN
jgi:type I restriction enzyme S subunit